MLAYIIVAVAVIWRLALPFVPNPAFHFTPVLAALLFFGARQPKKWLCVPLLLMASTDVILNAHYGYALKADVLVTWVWYAAVLFLGGWLKQKQSVLRVGVSALTGSVSFFLVSNFGVWAVWNLYPKNLGGLLACYAAGVPFYRNQLAGDLIFTAAVFGLPALVKLMQRERAENQLPAA
jgi:hypothetical protein